MRRIIALVAALAGAALPVAAQDSVPQPGGVRLTLRYDPGNRPSLVIVPGAGLDSVRAIFKRDLDFSDRFQTIITPEPDAVAAGAASPLNYGLYKNFGAAFALELVQTAGQTTVRLHDVNGGKVLNTMDTRFADAADPALRMQVHRASDEVVRWVTGTPGVAATRIAYVAAGRIMLMDFDGAAITALTPSGQTALSPAWSPTSDRIAYTRLGEGKGPVLIQRLSGGAPQMVPGSESALNITPMFSPDGQFVAYGAVGRAGHEYPGGQRPGHVLRTAVDHGSLRGQPFTDVRPGRPAHRLRIHPRRSAADLRHGGQRHQRRAACAVRLRRHGEFQRAGVVTRRRVTGISPRGVGRTPDLRARCCRTQAQAVVIVGPERGPDVGARWPSHRVRLGSHGTAADLGHRH
jgi:TolB protein